MLIVNNGETGIVTFHSLNKGAAKKAKSFMLHIEMMCVKKQRPFKVYI